MAQVKRVFLDANILFTASHNPQGLAFGLIQKSSFLKLEVFTSNYALEEARYNLALKYSDTVAVLEKLKERIRIIDVNVDSRWNPLNLPMDDLPIFQAALHCKAQFLITGDKKAFGKWMNKAEQTEGIRILMLREFIDEFLIK